MLSYLELMRPANCLMAAAAVLTGSLIVLGPGNIMTLSGTGGIRLALALIAVFLITGAGNAINDWRDMESDRVNRPDRPLPSGRIMPRAALAFSLGLFGIGIMMAGFVNYMALFIAVLNSAVLIFYTTHLQDKIIMGNIAVGYLVGSTFLFGGVVFGNIKLTLVLALLAGLATVSREIVKDMEDMEGDKRSFLKRMVANAATKAAERFSINTKGVRMKYRKRTALSTAAFTLILAVILSPLPYVFGVLGLPYLAILLPADMAFIASAIHITRSRARRDYSRASKAIKLGMLLGLLAFAAGVLF